MTIVQNTARVEHFFEVDAGDTSPSARRTTEQAQAPAHFYSGPTRPSTVDLRHVASSDSSGIRWRGRVSPDTAALVCINSISTLGAVSSLLNIKPGHCALSDATVAIYTIMTTLTVSATLCATSPSRRSSSAGERPIEQVRASVRFSGPNQSSTAEMRLSRPSDRCVFVVKLALAAHGTVAALTSVTNS